MSKYVQIKDGEPVAFELPSIGILPDGRQVSGFDKLDSDTLKTAGWVLVEDPGPPEYDSSKKVVERTLKMSGGKVIAIYTVSDLPEPEIPPESTPTTQEQLDALANILIAKGTITEEEVVLSKAPKRPQPPSPLTPPRPRP